MTPARLSRMLVVLGVAFRLRASQGGTLREVFDSKRCLKGESIYPFQDRTVVLEVNSWSSQQLVTAIAAILLRDRLGYKVVLNEPRDSVRTCQRILGDWKGREEDGDVVTSLRERGTAFLYGNMEVWADSSCPIDPTSKDDNHGSVGYPGSSGWFVVPEQSQPFNQFYRSYVYGPYREALQNVSSVDCAASDCVGSSAAFCPAPGGDGEQLWCPSGSNESNTPAVICAYPTYDQGMNEEVAGSHGLNLALRFLRASYFEKAWQVISDNGPEIIYAYRPSMLFAQLDNSPLRLSRVLMPNQDCGIHRSTGDGTWSCDFPPQRLLKATSRIVASDVIASFFFDEFRIPDDAGSELNGENETSLMGAGINGMMQQARIGDTSFTEPEGEVIFNVACKWVLANDGAGVDWVRWIVPRRWILLWADSTWEAYPYPWVFACLVVIALVIAFTEGPWLGTTLWPWVLIKLHKQHKHLSWRSGLEYKALRAQNSFVEFTQDHNADHHAETHVMKRDPLCNFVHKIKQEAAVTADRMRKRFTTQRDVKEYGTQSYLNLEDADQTARSARFWEQVEHWANEAAHSGSDLLGKDVLGKATQGSATSCPTSVRLPLEGCLVGFVHHTFPCVRSSGEVRLILERKHSLNARAHAPNGDLQAGNLRLPMPRVGQTEDLVLDDNVNHPDFGSEVVVSVAIEECGSGAKPGHDFKADKAFKVVFKPGERWAVLQIPVVHHIDTWEATSWFQVRLTEISSGPGVLASPARALVVLLCDDKYPANNPNPHDWGLHLLRYYIREARLRRGGKWWKTMAAVLYLPVHTVLIQTIVLKGLLDYAAEVVVTSEEKITTLWCYFMVLILSMLYLVSFAVVRWADTVQLRNRGRTGGQRQDHRLNLFKKFLSLEHVEHWQVDGPSWLYCGILEVDTIAIKAHWQIFKIAQSITGLVLSIVVALAVLLWDMAMQDANQSNWSTSFNPGSIVGIFVIIPLGLGALSLRRMLVYRTGTGRLEEEKRWCESLTWITQDWRQLSGSSQVIKAAFLNHFKKQSDTFLKRHQLHRDIMTDTVWVMNWLGGLGYCGMLFFGVVMFIEHERFSMGYMLAGTFYALLRVYGYVRRYMRELVNSFIALQHANLSLRDFVALLNLLDNESHRCEAEMWQRCWREQETDEGDGEANHAPGLRQLHCRHMRLPRELRLAPSVASAICFEDGVCFLRPRGRAKGANFMDLELKVGCMLPLGRITFVSSADESAACTFLGLVAGILQPTGRQGRALGAGDPRVFRPSGLHFLMAPPVHATSGGLNANAGTVLDELRLSGASASLCLELAVALGLRPDGLVTHMQMGESQLFSLARVLLSDPDVVCLHRPLVQVPESMQGRVVKLLQLWQAGGGLPCLAACLGLPEECASAVYRSHERTLILSNVNAAFWAENHNGSATSQLLIDLDAHRLRPLAAQQVPNGRSSLPSPRATAARSGYYGKAPVTQGLGSLPAPGFTPPAKEELASRSRLDYYGIGIPAPVAQELKKVYYLPKLLNGVQVLAPKTQGTWVADSTELCHRPNGVCCRRTKEVADKSDVVLLWGGTVRGIDDGDGWVKCSIQGSVHYLPQKVSGVSVLLPAGETKWRADNSILGARCTGVRYRESKHFNNTSDIVLRWGDTVRGTDLGDGWVKCDPKSTTSVAVALQAGGAPDAKFPMADSLASSSYYLPKTVKGIRILAPVEETVWRADNTRLMLRSNGLCYRETKELHTKSGIILRWGETVQGTDEGDGWIKCSMQDVGNRKASEPARSSSPESFRSTSRASSRASSKKSSNKITWPQGGASSGFSTPASSGYTTPVSQSAGAEGQHAALQKVPTLLLQSALMQTPRETADDEKRWINSSGNLTA